MISSHRFALLAAILLSNAGCNLRPLVRSAMAPRDAYVDQAHPPPPDYADPAAWSARPDRDGDTADWVPEGFPGIDQHAAPVDVFYVHPTSHVGRDWNGTVGAERLDRATDAVATGVQAPVFAGCCAIWAPRYRQATGYAFLDDSESARLAVDLAYSDVVAAFDAFQRARGADRPLVLAGHSQGAMLAARLLRERVWPEHHDQLVYALLPGAPLGAAALVQDGIPLCQRRDDTGCVVTYNARWAAYRDRGFEPVVRDPFPLACVDPVTYAGASTRADHGGAVFPEARDPSVRPHFASAGCTELGWLEVEHDRAPRDLASRILDRVMGPGNAHPIEFQLFFVDLRRNADERTAAWFAREPPQNPQNPTPIPPVQLGDPVSTSTSADPSR